MLQGTFASSRATIPLLEDPMSLVLTRFNFATFQWKWQWTQVSMEVSMESLKLGWREEEEGDGWLADPALLLPRQMLPACPANISTLSFSQSIQTFSHVSSSWCLLSVSQHIWAFPPPPLHLPHHWVSTPGFSPCLANSRHPAHFSAINGLKLPLVVDFPSQGFIWLSTSYKICNKKWFAQIVGKSWFLLQLVWILPLCQDGPLQDPDKLTIQSSGGQPFNQST